MKNKFLIEKYVSHLNEMAYGKPGRRTKEQKAADDAAEAEKNRKVLEHKKKRIEFQHNFETILAPEYKKQYHKELHNHLIDNGFKLLHSGEKRSVYIKIDPKKEHFHSVTVNKHDGYEPNRTSIRYSNHGGGSYGSIEYNPSAHWHDYDTPKEKIDSDEKTTRTKAIMQLHDLHTGKNFRIDD